MSSAFRILVICLIIPSRCVVMPQLISEKTTRTVEEQVEQVLSSIKESLNNIINPLTHKDVKLVEAGVIEGKVEKIIEQSIVVERMAKHRIHKLIEEKGILKERLGNIKLKALRIFVVPYLCRNLELYENVWDCGGQNSLNFDPDDLENTAARGRTLDAQTLSNYKSHAKKWDRILQSSTHPLVKYFKTKIQQLYPGISLQIIAKNIGLAHAFLNNAKHGAMNDDPDLKALINPDDVVLALKKWDALNDPVVLNIIKTFEEVISGL